MATKKATWRPLAVRICNMSKRLIIGNHAYTCYCPHAPQTKPGVIAGAVGPGVRGGGGLGPASLVQGGEWL